GRRAPGGGRTRGHAGVRPVRRTASRSDPAGDRPGGVRGRPARGPAGTAPPAVRPGPAHAGTRRPLPRSRTAHGGRALRRAGQTGRPRPRRHRPAGRPGCRSPGPRRPARRPRTPGRHRAALGPRAGREITAPPRRLRIVHPDTERYVPMALPLSILDLAYIGKGETAADAFAGSVELARRAEQWGYHRIWYAEHHNMPTIASSATSVLIAHVAAHTSRIRLGAGGVMLPNHAPLTIAEQYGTLETLHPGRIDLGLGRAPGSDQKTMWALRRDAASADRFPQDVLELQGYLTGESRVPGVDATPGKGTNVPLYILGSSLFGARLAAALGLPYSFASHFAPDALQAAVAAYRNEFQPSEQLAEPYVIAGANVIAADTVEEAEQDSQIVKRSRLRL